MKSDIEIAKEFEKKQINEIAKKLNVDGYFLECYGKYKAKIDNKIFDKLKDKKDGKLILVTSINPTPLGEGKTTMSIGINDALCKLGKNSILALREPSLGPVFGVKGGATGGGYSQVVPMEDINLHFTGDLHALTSANNLLAALIDNHIKQGNILNIDINNIVFKRCLDINDRALRTINVALGGDINGTPREDHFVITVASEFMAILCLASDLKDLKRRISNILVGYSLDNKPIFVSDLKCEGALTVLLKDAIKPNLVQTLENNPALIHGGPFANIAHGCNSIIATKMALKLSDYVVTEAGFGSDLGALKFLDIKCREHNIKPNVIVIVATIKALKYNGGVAKTELKEPDLEALAKGMPNLIRHIENMQKFVNNVIVCLNKYETDSFEEVEYIKQECEKLNCEFDISESFAKGGIGANGLAEKIVEMCKKETNLNLLYDETDDIKNKIEIICKNIYRADKVIYSNQALSKMENIIKINKDKLPICIAKTPYSFSDDMTLLGAPVGFNMTVTDINLLSGAGFIVVAMGDIMTMPGLPKTPAALKIDIDDNDNIIGLF